MPSLYKVLGLMSGTSLDGLDLAYCIFNHAEGRWNFNIEVAETLPYDSEWENKLRHVALFEEEDLKELDLRLGEYFGVLALEFIQRHGITPDFISSHGHTVFHQPEEGITYQIGNGPEMVKITGLPVYNDFRTQDVSMGGQGAPLVPIGDQLLFKDYKACLNLGGIANISFEQEGRRVAYDICPANMPMNFIANRIGLPYDKDGRLAKSGKRSEQLLTHLNSLEYYSKEPPKSLGYEWVHDQVIPALHESESPEDLLSTLVDHTAEQIAKSINKITGGGTVLCTGGGALNSYLMGCIRDRLEVLTIEVPESDLVQFKEALVFAFLGVLKSRDEVNVLSSVTGATKDHSAGVLNPAS